MNSKMPPWEKIKNWELPVLDVSQLRKNEVQYILKFDDDDYRVQCIMYPRQIKAHNKSAVELAKKYGIKIVDATIK